MAKTRSRAGAEESCFKWPQSRVLLENARPRRVAEEQVEEAARHPERIKTEQEKLWREATVEAFRRGWLSAAQIEESRTAGWLPVIPAGNKSQERAGNLANGPTRRKRPAPQRG